MGQMICDLLLCPTLGGQWPAVGPSFCCLDLPSGTNCESLWLEVECSSGGRECQVVYPDPHTDTCTHTYTPCQTSIKLNSDRSVFPDGISHEYSITAMFRLRKTTKKDRWFVLQIFDKGGDTQVSLIVDGAKKTVEFLAQGFLKNSLLYVFKNRDLHALFDRQFHKLGVSVESNAVSIYLDCKLIERQVTAERSGMNVSGRTFITSRVEDGRPVDIELQEILLFCDPRIADLDRCCDSPGVTCEPVVTHNPTAAPLVTGYLHRMLSMPAQLPTDRCHCPTLKGDQGLPGLAGHSGQNGDKGDMVRNGFYQHHTLIFFFFFFL
ncbi:Collagen alpha-1(XIX) chain [Labeo rohita]|uniref:Collagen alpha-1(XIX) chain n=1 Tax=Labeo rohita TaxID=84645 RepID=A0ABQ8M740_LABRO|nr:Collagen alpha-1(XIX) chain [Labeo rohita]